MTLPASAFPLSVSGARILGADGNPVRLAGVNWGGAQQDEGVPYGLDRLPRAEIIARIAAMGLNTVRLPFATGHILTSKGAPVTSVIPAYRVSANPDLAGMTSWQVYQRLVSDLTAAGLYVVCVCMQMFPGWCCSDSDNNGLWYNDNWPSSVFSNAWFTVAEAFASNPRTGFDIKNEPRPATVGGKTVTPSWGNGVWGTDFCRMYSWHAGQLRQRSPGALIFCEGLNYASDLTGWASHPVPGAVASLHDYPWFHKGTTSYAAYEAAMDARIPDLGVPLWAGEFGTSTDVPLAALQSGWLPWFITWAARRGLHWCWWELSATAVKGTMPGTNAVSMQFGQREAFSLLAGQDWRGTQVDLLGMLAPVMP